MPAATHRIITPNTEEARVEKLRKAKQMLSAGYSMAVVEKRLHVAVKTLKKWSKTYNLPFETK
jgi:transposase-like protein